MFVCVTKLSDNSNPNGVNQGNTYYGKLHIYDKFGKVKAINNFNELATDHGIYVDGPRWLQTTLIKNVVNLPNEQSSSETVCKVQTKNSTYLIEVCSLEKGKIK